MDLLDDAREKGEETVQKAKAACCCSCLGFILFPLMITLLAYNEKRFVCTETAYDAAEEAMQVVDCTSQGAQTGDLIYLQGCALGHPSTFSAASTYGMGAMVSNGVDVPHYTGYMSKMRASMYQCKEDVTTEKQGKEEVKVYKYSKVWSESYFGALQNPGDVQKKNAVCGPNPNPVPPQELASNMGDAADDHLITGTDATLGEYLLDEDLIQKMALDKYVDMNKFGDAFTATANKVGPSSLTPQIFAARKDHITTCPVSAEIGCIQLSFQTTSATVASAFGAVMNSDKITKWYAPETWLCSSEGVMNLVTSDMPKNEMLKLMHEGNSNLLMMLRICGWLGVCLSIYMALYPLFAFFDILSDYIECIPCVGDFIADSIDTLVGCALCCGSFFVGTTISVFVIAVSWVFVRPIVGIPLLLLSLAMAGGLVYWRSTMQRSGSKQQQLELDGSDLSEDDGDA
eukprot:TRINITY_DN73740_c0_g1_i1.p1 TRINITY_DN73740_c0_g1~~TRINITY_DN73740_c0_g1_i1.p1  ORF type:complete len:458 (+),score=113.49 TRINITY_DN73740_c0_g1_i1:66-1439(+)